MLPGRLGPLIAGHPVPPRKPLSRRIFGPLALPVSVFIDVRGCANPVAVAIAVLTIVVPVTTDELKQTSREFGLYIVSPDPGANDPLYVHFTWVTRAFAASPEITVVCGAFVEFVRVTEGGVGPLLAVYEMTHPVNPGTKAVRTTEASTVGGRLSVITTPV
jgi:hypothetical protein